MTDVIDTVQLNEIADPILEFFDITLPGHPKSAGDTTGTFHLFPGLEQGGNATVTFDGNEYHAIPIQLTGQEVASSGTIARPSLAIANIPALTKTADSNKEMVGVQGIRKDSDLTLPFETNDDLIGTKIVYRRAFESALDTSSPPEFPSQTYFIDRVASENNIIATFELASPMDVEGVTIPARRIVGKYCSWQYQGKALGFGGGCSWGYTAADQGGYIDIDNNRITGILGNWDSISGGTYSANDKVFTEESGTNQRQIWEAIIASPNKGTTGAKDPRIFRRYWKRIDVCGKVLNSCKVRFQKDVKNFTAVAPVSGDNTKTTITFADAHPFAVGDEVVIYVTQNDTLRTALSGTKTISAATTNTITIDSTDISSAASLNSSDKWVEDADFNKQMHLPFGGFPGSKQFR